MPLTGRFITDGGGLVPETVLQNTLTDEGEVEYLKMIFQGNAALIASGGNFFVGLTTVTPADTVTLSQCAAAEPTSAGGYARQALSRDSTGWPTLSAVNGENSIRSKTVNFVASGADYDASITRMFLTDTLSGPTGTLLSISAAFANAVTVSDGATLPVAYESFIY